MVADVLARRGGVVEGGEMPCVLVIIPFKVSDLLTLFWAWPVGREGKAPTHAMAVSTEP